jgi:hypothetical protein
MEVLYKFMGSGFNGGSFFAGFLIGKGSNKGGGGGCLSTILGIIFLLIIISIFL